MLNKVRLYFTLNRVLHEVNDDRNLSAANVVDTIKENLKQRGQTSDEDEKKYCNHLYTCWQDKNFNINHKFDVEDELGSKRICLLSMAIDNKLSTLSNLARALIKGGANVQNEDYLHACALSGSPEVLIALIEAGENDSTSKGYGCTALHCAARFYSNMPTNARYKKCCEILIEHTLKNNPSMESPSFIKEKKELASCWNACKTNIEEFIVINPNTKVQEMSYVGREMCMIQ